MGNVRRLADSADSRSRIVEGSAGDTSENDVPPPRRRVGRPNRSEGPAVTREAIVRVALQVLTAHGTAGFALRDIARRLGVSLPTIQQHFHTKDDLFRVCVDTIVDDTPVSVDNDLAGNPTPLLSNFIRHLIERTAKYPRATAAMWNDNEPGAEERLNYLFERISPRIEIARTNVGAAIAVGVFRDIDPEVFLALMSLGISSLVSSRFPLRNIFGIDLDDKEELGHFVDELSEIVLYGIVSPKANLPRQ